MAEGGVEIRQPVQEKVDPVIEFATAADKLINLFNLVGWATRRRLAGGSKDNPLFFVPALSGDLNGIRPLMRETALQGRRVITVGYPESFMGKTTEAFANASRASVNFEPHTTYFKQAIENLVGPNGDFELWGYSAGAGLVTEILQDHKFQQRVANAVIIAPEASHLSFLTKAAQVVKYISYARDNPLLSRNQNATIPLL